MMRTYPSGGGSREARRLRMEVANATALGVRPFVAPPCARCKTPLTDRHGNPRWDIIGKLTFVCANGCLPASVRRKAGLT